MTGQQGSGAEKTGMCVDGATVTGSPVGVADPAFFNDGTRVTGDQMRAFGARLRAARELRGLKQREVAAHLATEHGAATNDRAVGAWEAGRRLPTTRQLYTLATYLEVSVDWLFGLDGVVRPRVGDAADPVLLANALARREGESIPARRRSDGKGRRSA